MLFPMDTVLILGIIQFQLCTSFTKNNEQIISNNSTWVVGVGGRIDSAYQPPGFNPENVEEGVKTVEKTFEAKTEAWVDNKKNYHALEKSSFWNQKVGVGTFIIFAICFSCLVTLCGKCCEDYYPTVQRRQPNRTRRVIQGISRLVNRQPSPRAYRIQTQSSGLREYHLAAPMRDFTVNMFTNSNYQGGERSSSSSGGGATASARPPPHSRSARAYRIRTCSV